MQVVVAFLLAICLLGASAVPAAALEVQIDTSGGSQTFSDADLDGIVDWNVTIGGVLQTFARAKETVEGINSKIALAPLPPFSDGIFRNVSLTDQTFTVTVKSTVLSGLVGPPLGWDLFYRAAVDDITALGLDDQIRLLDWLGATDGRVQVISVTSRSVAPLIETGAFLSMLYYRLNVVCLDLTGRERRAHRTG